MTEQQFNDITKWQNETFENATAISKLKHLALEIHETQYEVAIKSDKAKLEFADCFILLFGAASCNGMTYQDICNAIDDKMKINKERTWGKPDENGVVNHIKI